LKRTEASSSGSPCAGLKLTTLVQIGTDYIGSFKSSYHKITTTMASSTSRKCEQMFSTGYISKITEVDPMFV
jgi:hypothetical protein